MDIKSKQINDIYLLKAVSLEEIFESHEIDDILKENCFWNMDSEEENSLDEKKAQQNPKTFSRYKKHFMNFDRGSLVMKFITIAIDKLKHTHKAVAKGLNWVKTEIQDKLVCQEATPSIINKKGDLDYNNHEFKNIMSWIDENITYNNVFIKDEVVNKRKSASPLNFKIGKNTTNLSLIEQNINTYKHRNSLNSLEMFKFTLRKYSPANKMNGKNSVNKESILEIMHKNNQNTFKVEKIEEDISDDYDSVNKSKENDNNKNKKEEETSSYPIDTFVESTYEIQQQNSLRMKKLNSAILEEGWLEANDIICRSNRIKHLKRNMMNLNDLLILDENVPKSVNSKNFDIFQFEIDVGRVNCLPFLTFEIFFNYDLYAVINLNAMENFIQNIRDGYLKLNPYHNDLHAGDVLQTCYSMMYNSNILDIMSYDAIDISGYFISAIIHDFKHPGVTNGFLINTKDTLSIKYNDSSVLENFHVSETFRLIQENKDCNIFSMLSNNEYKLIRKRIIDCVLATDMTKHAHGYHYLKMKIETYEIKNGANVDKIISNLDDNSKNQTKQEFLNTLIHLADISNPTKPLKVYKQWAEFVMNEFWLQGDKERELGIPFSFLCDRRTTKLPAAQVGFMSGIVLPLTQIVVEMFPTLYFMVENIMINTAYYKKLKEEDSNEGK